MASEAAFFLPLTMIAVGQLDSSSGSAGFRMTQLNRPTLFNVMLNEAKRRDSIQHFQSQHLSQNLQSVTDV
jgi:hypothetical protein